MTLPVRALEFYSGIGGLHISLQRSAVSGDVVQAFDWDQSACQVYETFTTDISMLSAADLTIFNANLWLLSPSCQPYTVLNPLAKGAQDPRAKSFIHLIENVLPELMRLGQQPSYLLVENVAGFETSTTRTNLLHTLDSLGYTYIELLLTPLQYGIPNSRLRYYLLAKSNRLPFAYTKASGSRVWRHIPGQGEDWSDPRLQSDLDTLATIKPLRDFLDCNLSEDQERQLAIPDRILEKWGRLFDIILPSQRRSCCFTRGYTKLVERAGSILQINEELDTTTVFDRFLATQTSGDSAAVDGLRPLRLRYFSPTELLRIFGFNSPNMRNAECAGYNWPVGISLKTQYKLVGNSVNTVVVTKLIDYLFLEYSAVSEPPFPGPHSDIAHT